VRVPRERGRAAQSQKLVAALGFVRPRVHFHPSKSTELLQSAQGASVLCWFQHAQMQRLMKQSAKLAQKLDDSRVTILSNTSLAKEVAFLYNKKQDVEIRYLVTKHKKHPNLQALLDLLQRNLHRRGEGAASMRWRCCFEVEP
jgi:hypothetical protein